MKKLAILPALALTLLIGLSASRALATVDAITTVYLVTHDFNSGDFDVIGYQYNGCYGINEGPQSAAFTEPFMIEAPRGCGGPSYKEDVNALSCADAEYVWDEGHNYVKDLTIDVSTCDDDVKNSQEFQIMVKKAAKKNFSHVWDVKFKGL